MSAFIWKAFAVGAALAVGGCNVGSTGRPPAQQTAQARNPCATRNPCASRNPCAAKNPCAARNPCAAQNPCAARNPCAATNPCAARTPAAAVKDPVAEAAFKQYKSWKQVNTEPVLSATHGNRYVFTYINKQAEDAGMTGKFPFAVGSVLAKESFEGQAGKPGPKGPLFTMEKRKQGYDSAHGDWHYAIVDPAGTVMMAGSGKEGHPTAFCAACHTQAKANDYVFGVGTTMKVKPVAMGAPATSPCAATNPCAAKNPCAATNPCAPKNPCAGRNPCAPKNPCAPRNPCAGTNPGTPRR